MHTIWVHLGPLGCLTELGAKRAELVQKIVTRSRVRIFRKERTRSTPLDPKLTFWFFSYYLGAFRTVWLPYESRCKTGRTSAKVRATKSRQNFSQRTPSIYPHWTINCLTKGSKTRVLGPMGWIGCFRCEKFQCEFVAQTFALVRYVLLREW